MRLAAHRRGNGKGSVPLPKEFKSTILFTGTVEQCFELERQLRPRPGIGWNRAGGGQKSCLGFKHSEEAKRNMSRAIKGKTKGIPKPAEHRAKISAATKARYANPAAHAQTSAAVKAGLSGINRHGANNPNFGNHTCAIAKQKMRKRIIARGGVNGVNNPNFDRRRRRLLSYGQTELDIFK
jgi:hypothetical protein